MGTSSLTDLSNISSCLHVAQQYHKPCAMFDFGSDKTVTFYVMLKVGWTSLSCGRSWLWLDLPFMRCWCWAGKVCHVVDLDSDKTVTFYEVLMLSWKSLSCGRCWFSHVISFCNPGCGSQGYHDGSLINQPSTDLFSGARTVVEIVHPVHSVML